MAVLEDLLRPTLQRRLWSGGLLFLLFLFSILVTTVPNSGRSDVLSPDADGTENLDTGDQAWMYASCALVLFMTPGLGFFYGGMVRRTSLISTLLQSFIIMGMILVLWVILGYTLAFGPDWGSAGILGNPSAHYFFKGVGAAPDPNIAGTISLNTFALFQATFAMITPALITGAVAERASFNAVMAFCGIWHFLVYCPMAHMEWHYEGLIFTFGHHDFAGGTVVHMTSGWTALTLSWLIGKRLGEKSELHSPAHVPYVMLGTAMLWFGWFGFNGGSALGAGPRAAQALMTTNAATGSALCAWILWDYIQGRKVSTIGACGGAVVGLVAITPGCGFVTVGGAMCMGAMASIISNCTLHWMKEHGKIDDTLDVWACHGLGGTMGMILTACFSDPAVYDDDLPGLFYGGGTLFWHTLVVGALVIPYCMIMTFLIYTFVNFFIPFRVSEAFEREGLDSSLHGEVVPGFNFDPAHKPGASGNKELDDSRREGWAGNGGEMMLKATGGTAQSGSPSDSDPAVVA